MVDENLPESEINKDKTSDVAGTLSLFYTKELLPEHDLAPKQWQRKENTKKRGASNDDESTFRTTVLIIWQKGWPDRGLDESMHNPLRLNGTQEWSPVEARMERLTGTVTHTLLKPASDQTTRTISFKF